MHRAGKGIGHKKDGYEDEYVAIAKTRPGGEGQAMPMAGDRGQGMRVFNPER